MAATPSRLTPWYRRPAFKKIALAGLPGLMMTTFLLWTVNTAGKLPRPDRRAPRNTAEMELTDVAEAEQILHDLRGAAGRLDSHSAALSQRSRTAFRLPITESQDAAASGTAIQRQVDQAGRQRVSISLDGVARREAEMAASGPHAQSQPGPANGPQ